MLNIQSVAPTYPANVRKVNFQAGDNRRQYAPVSQTQMMDPQQAMLMRAMQDQQKKEKKRELRNNIVTGVSVASGLAIIAIALKSLKGGGMGDVMKESKKAVDKIEQSIINLDKEKTLEQLMLPKELQQETKELKVLLERNEQLKRKGMKGNAAIMLYGEPGGGKNAYVYGVAKHIQSMTPGSELIPMEVLKFNSKWLGETENNILNFTDNIIKRAKSNPNKRIVVFLDEFDSISRKATGSGAENSEKFQNAFKTSFNKLLEVDNLHIIAATNKAAKDAPLNQLLDEAILNRFAKKIHVPLPTKEQLKNAFVNEFKLIPNDTVNKELLDVNNKTLENICEYVSRKDHHASFRDMNYIISRARILSEAESKSRPISMQDLVQATKEHAESMNWKDTFTI